MEIQTWSHGLDFVELKEDIGPYPYQGRFIRFHKDKLSEVILYLTSAKEFLNSEAKVFHHEF